MTKSISTIKAITVVFLASACTMVIELVAGRILAPYIGVSLFTWTSIIGVVLAGISLGNYLGGKVGDRYPSTLVLSGIFFAGGVFSLAILPLTMLLKNSPLPTSVHLMSRATVYTFVLFFLPTTVLGMTTPIVARLVLRDVGRTANVVGTLYAFSTVGAIVGTFLTGFWLISWFGTRAIVWQVAIVLFLLAVFTSGFWKSKAKWSMLLVTLLLYTGTFQFRDKYQITYTRESNYYTINVYDSNLLGRNVKALSLDHLIHSYVDVNDPRYHGYDYEKTFAGVARYVAGGRTDLKFLCVGGGGYTFSRYLEATYPRSSIEVVEIDPAVTEVAYSELGLPRTSRIVTHNTDGRIFLIDKKASQEYDVVFGDAFNDMSVPYHLTTVEFNETVRRALKPDGFYVVNLIDNLSEGQFVRSFMKTLSQSFRQVYLVTTNVGRGMGTWIVVATNRSFNTTDLTRVYEANNPEFGPAKLLTLQEIEETVGKNRALVLTDDFAPVDIMIAPLFVNR